MLGQLTDTIADTKLRKQLPELEANGTLDALTKKHEAISALLKDPALHSASLREADPEVKDLLKQVVSSEAGLTVAAGELGASLLEAAKHPAVAAAVLKDAKDNPVVATAALQGVLKGPEALSPVLCTASRP